MTQKNDPFLGKRIREYEILEVIGKGGMGAVYRARHIYLDEERAIKVIESEWAEDEDFIHRFIREARVLTRLRHPNLVELFEFGTLENNVFFMVLEFLKGESVLSRIRRLKKIPVAEATKIIHEAALGLQQAHDKDIVHRDISPDNLLLVKNNEGIEITKVIDFGIAKPRFESGQRLTVANLFIGKPEFCSPEQCGILGEEERIDGRSDIYSLAVCFYYMVTGNLPLSSATAHGYLSKHLNETPKSISSHFGPGEISESLERLIMKSLSKNRNDRPSSMKEFADALISTSQSAVPVAMVGLKTEPTFTALQPGDVFARRYRVEKLIGIGRLGSVYKAVDKFLDVPIALKVLSLEISGDSKSLERFKREVIHARKITHPNVCRTFDIGEAAGTHYVSMEFLEGKTLARMIQDQGPMQIEIGIPIVRQVLDALKEAHRVGLIHSDLKPQNIMVDDKLRACIMDFGIRVSPGAGTLTPAGTTVGNPDYMAPELFEDKNIDNRADIYSMGIMLYEVFAGRHPFGSLSPVEMIAAHLEKIPPQLSSFVPTIPSGLENIILKALQKDPAKRFRSAADLLQALDPLSASPKSVESTEQQYLANRLLAERNFLQAIEYLRSLLDRDPENLQWKKLLSIATTEKAREELRRVRILIKKGEYQQAKLRLEKIRNLNPDDTRTLEQIEKLELNIKQQTLERQNSQRETDEIELTPIPVIEPTSAEHSSRSGDQVPVQIPDKPFVQVDHHFEPEKTITRKQDRSEIAIRLFGTGRIFYDQGRFQEALDSFEAASKLLPQDQSLMEWIEVTQSALHQQTNHRDTHMPRSGKSREVADHQSTTPKERRDAEYDRLMKQGIAHFESERWHEALKCFLIAAQLNSAGPDLQNYIRATGAKQRELSGVKGSKLNIAAPARVQRPEAEKARPPVTLEAPSSRLPLVMAVALSLGILILSSGAWLGWRYFQNHRKAQESAGAPPVIPATISTVTNTVIVPAVRADVVVNVLPWAIVKISPLKNDTQYAEVIAERATPFSIELSEGEYVLEFYDKNLKAPVRQTIRVGPEKRNEFLFKTSQYDPERSTEQVLAIR